MVWDQVQTVRKLQDISTGVDMVQNKVKTVRKLQDVLTGVNMVQNQVQTVKDLTLPNLTSGNAFGALPDSQEGLEHF